MPLLARGFEVIAPDLPGHGQSEAVEGWKPDLERFTGELLRALKLDRASFIGSSFGGGILIRFAAASPDRIDKLVLVAPTGIPAVESDAVVRAYPKPKDLFEAFRRSIHDSRLATRELYREIARLQKISAPFIPRYRAALPEGYRERGWIPEMRQIRNPTLVVWGDEDRIVPFVFAERLTGYIPGARLEVLRGAGHFPYFEKPEEFALACAPFLSPGF